ncbi:maleylpyruvate isomerase family mycothiol-dependent enzyme [Streptomyces beihaiensis]|uniref:Maleylpyruvate isomerase family mycothiol-dependent enzyme n=1 Tax=Streptomyces beihaiensis TaxID=2984495 RepID=A0ABT3TZH7_9ACTN|nr:maleylpyruvate isomerase family mycothiol-dependent enzyme [Streptomyces beihaiensis]MCX3062468.1 maleylpyruvate isomerase family mycothiol-dependent enzyme [Streptomyces beihaiensis]
MPPATKKRTRSYDADKVTAAVVAQFEAVRKAVAGLTPEQLAAPTRLGEWTVRDLAAHFTMAMDFACRAVAEPAPTVADFGFLDYFGLSAKGAPAVAEAVPRLAASATLDELFARTSERIAENLVPGIPGDRPVATRIGAMTYADLMVTRAIEVVVHSDDLDGALPGLDLPYERQALAACTRVFADALAAKAPGASTEVRIPPFAVVQCVAGPRHTRGTPPNVVETDPLTWVRLATGRTRWAEAVHEALVSASGERADLEGLLPIMA